MSTYIIVDSPYGSFAHPSSARSWDDTVLHLDRLANDVTMTGTVLVREMGPDPREGGYGPLGSWYRHTYIQYDKGIQCTIM